MFVGQTWCTVFFAFKISFCVIFISILRWFSVHYTFLSAFTIHLFILIGMFIVTILKTKYCLHSFLVKILVMLLIAYFFLVFVIIFRNPSSLSVLRAIRIYYYTTKHFFLLFYSIWWQCCYTFYERSKRIRKYDENEISFAYAQTHTHRDINIQSC